MGRRLLDGGIQIRKCGGGAGSSDILIVQLTPSAHVRVSLLAYSGRMRTAVPAYPQTRCVVKPVFVVNVSIAGSTC